MIILLPTLFELWDFYTFRKLTLTYLFPRNIFIIKDRSLIQIVRKRQVKSRSKIEAYMAINKKLLCLLLVNIAIPLQMMLSTINLFGRPINFVD